MSYTLNARFFRVYGVLQRKKNLTELIFQTRAKRDIFVGRMKRIEERERELISEFEMFGDWMEKYEYIIDLGKELPPLNQEFKIENNLIKGCQSQVWLHAFNENGTIKFEADSDALITKGLVGLMMRVFSGCSPTEIVDSDLSFIKKIGLQEHLSPNRSNGLVSMIKQMKNYAFALQNK